MCSSDLPRHVGARFVHGYLVGSAYRFTPRGPESIPERVEARAKALTVTRDLTAQDLEEFLTKSCPMADETYGWRLAEVLHVFEGFLGTEPVARAVVSHLLRALSDPELWGFGGHDPQRRNASGHHLALEIGRAHV